VLSPRTVLFALAAASMHCSPYDPELGPTPFLCGASEPRCPDGYVCVEATGTDGVCSREGVTPGGDGGGLCIDEHEPNESMAVATLVPIPDEGENHMTSAAVCSPEDVDFYRLFVDTTGKTVRIDVTFEALDAPPDLRLLNGAGTLVESGASEGNGTLRVEVQPPQGTYFASVSGMTADLPYTINFTVTAGTLPP